MATSITAHVVVDFNADGDTPNVIVEVDGREEGYNAGRTSFYPGEQAFLLLYVPQGWVCSATYVSSGTLAKFASNIIIPVTDTPVFIDDTPASLQYELYSGFSYQWMGENLGAVSCVRSSCSVPKRAYNATSGLYTPPHRVGIAKVAYNAKADVYRISNVPLAVEKVAALFVVTKA